MLKASPSHFTPKKQSKPWYMGVFKNGIKEDPKGLYFSAGTQVSHKFYIQLPNHLPSTTHITDGETDLVRAGIVYEFSVHINDMSHKIYNTRIRIYGSIHEVDRSPTSMIDVMDDEEFDENSFPTGYLNKWLSRGMLSKLSCETLPASKMKYTPGGRLPIYNLTYIKCSSYAINLVKRTTFIFSGLTQFRKTEKIVFTCCGEIHIQGGKHCVMFTIPTSAAETMMATKFYQPQYFFIEYYIEVVGVHQIMPDLILKIPITLYNTTTSSEEEEFEDDVVNPFTTHSYENEWNDERYRDLTSTWDEIENNNDARANIPNKPKQNQESMIASLLNVFRVTP